MSLSMQPRGLRAASFVVGLVGMSAALAQTRDETRGEPVGRALEEVVVTAQKRAESVHDVPISISVLTGDNLENYGFTEMRDLDRLVPNLRVGKSAASDGISIRGVGSPAGSLTVEQSVALFVDGVYGGRAHQFQQPFLDLERVEVLRGPQGGLAGKNTMAGAINVITRGPTDEFEAEFTAAHEFELSGYEASGILSGPITDRFRARIAAKYEETEGWIDNPLYRGKKEPFTDTVLVRATGVFDATENVTVTGKIGYSRVDETGCFYETKGPTEPRALTHVNGCNGFERTNERDFDLTESPNATLTVDWDIGEHRLTSITAYSAYDWSKITDGDFSDLDLVVARFSEEYEQYSQEVRWISPTGGKLDYVVGAYYHMYELLSNRQNSYNRPPLNGASIRMQDQDDDLVSVFGATTWHINDVLRLSGSLRYTHEKKEAFMTRERTPVAPGLDTDFGDTRTEDHWDPAASLQWDVTDRTMLFVTYTRGSKGGGFAGDSNTVRPENFQFEDETSQSYEVGVKYEGNNARFSLVAYRSEFEDLQVSILDPTISAFSTENVGKSRSQGIEAEAMWVPITGLTLSGAAAYLDAEYTYWPAGPCLYPNDAIPSCRQDRAGTKFDTPEWTGTVQVAYERPMTASLDFLLSFQAAYQGASDRYNNPRCMQDSFTKYDARVGIQGNQGRWHATLRGKNITDEWTFSGCPPTPLRAGFYTYNTEPPRTLAMEVGFRF